MDLYQDVFFRALDKLRGRRTIERLYFLRQSQYWERAKLFDWQLQRLNELLQHSRENSPYYREVLSAIALPLRRLEEIQQIPILTKQKINQNFAAIQATNIDRKRFVASRTGGSTGEPMHYFWDKRGQDWNRGSVYRSAEWAGIKLGEKTVQMTGSHFDFTEAQKLKNQLVYFLQRNKDMPVAYLTEELLERYFWELMKFRPTSIWGYASGLVSFAHHIEIRHTGAVFPYLKAIITSSESLLPKHRELINRVFGKGIVFDHYGSREMYLASECNQHNGYHLHAEVVYCEVVSSDGSQCKPGELGRVLLTDLSNHAFPFIRYEIGDMAVLEPPEADCACGVKLPRLARVEGRIADMVRLRDRILTPPNFTIIMSDFEGVKSYQIRQPRIDHLDVLLVVEDNFDQRVFEYIRSAIVEMVGGTATVNLEVVETLELPESGKRRFVISEVATDYF